MSFKYAKAILGERATRIPKFYGTPCKKEKFNKCLSCFKEFYLQSEGNIIAFVFGDKDLQLCEITRDFFVENPLFLFCLGESEALL